MTGQKETVVFFLPGMLCGAWFWRFFGRVGGGGVKGHYLELPGLYGAGHPLLTFGAEVKAYARQIARLAEGREVVLVAHSYGAQHALALAEIPDLKVGRLVLVAPALGRWWMVKAMMRIVQWMWQGRSLRSAFVGVGDEAVPKADVMLDEMAVGLRHGWAQVLAITLRAGRALVPDGKVPTLVVWPRGDVLIGKVMLPASVEQVDVDGGHFKFLAHKDVWQIMKI